MINWSENNILRMQEMQDESLIQISFIPVIYVFDKHLEGRKNGVKTWEHRLNR